MEPINVLVCTDDKYVQQCGIMLTSLFVNNKLNSIRVFVLSAKLNSKNKSLLRTTADCYNVNIIFLTIDNQMLNGFSETIKSGDHVSLAAYYRIFCSYVLPNNLDKILYLDCDIVVNCDIIDLYNYNIDGYAIAGIVDENYFSIDNYNRLGLDKNITTYINSGVLLINLNYWRKYNVTSRCVDCVCKMPNKLLFHDQDTLNVVLNNEIKYLPISWNFQTGFLYCINQDRYDDAIRNEILITSNSPKIIHFTGKSKPWFKGCRQPYKMYYLYYKSISEWRDCKLLGKESIWFKLKRMIYNFLCFLGFKKKRDTYIIKLQKVSK